MPLSNPLPSAAPQNLLSVEGVTLRYRTHSAMVTATSDVSFTVGEGERLVLLGPSGKSCWTAAASPGRGRTG